jgi:hypothetical protein
MPGECKFMEERRIDCQGEFNRIWERLSSGDHAFDLTRDCANNLDRRVTILETNMIMLVKSMSSLTRALWGAALAVAATGVGFIIWYIQDLK